MRAFVRPGPGASILTVGDLVTALSGFAADTPIDAQTETVTGEVFGVAMETDTETGIAMARLLIETKAKQKGKAK